MVNREAHQGPRDLEALIDMLRRMECMADQCRGPVCRELLEKLTAQLPEPRRHRQLGVAPGLGGARAFLRLALARTFSRGRKAA